MKRLRTWLALVLVLVALLVSTPPSAFALNMSLVASIGTSTVNADTTYTHTLTVTSHFAVAKTVMVRLMPPIGWYFTGATTVNTGSMSCVDTLLRERRCTITNWPAGAARTFTTPTGVGQDLVIIQYTNGFFTDATVDGIAYSEPSGNLYPSKGTGFYIYAWDADVFRYPPVEYQHSTSYTEWLWLTIPYPSARTGKITFWVGNLGTINSMTLCKSDANGNCIGGNLGTFAWTDGPHHGANITYASWDNSKYRLTVSFTWGATTGTSLMQTTFVDAANYRSSDQSQNNIVN